MSLTYISVCSGIEAASVAWKPLDFKPIAFSEIEPFPCALLNHHYPNVPNLGDMTKMRGDSLHADILIGGTPCQAFSVAGKRRSLTDKRGNLTLKFCKLADQIDPNIIVWENVPGVLSTKDNAFGCFLGKLAGESMPLNPSGKRWANAGFVLGPKRAIAWRTLDAQYFGVAQRRRRVFVVASPTDGPDPRKVLFESEGMRRDTPSSRKERQGLTENFGNGFSTSGAGYWRKGVGPLRGRNQDSHENIVSHWQGGPHPSLSQSHNTGGIGSSNQELFSQGGAGLVGKPWPAKIASCLNAHYGDKAGLEDQHINQGAPLFVQEQCRVRRLTEIECERLQGFPDNYTNIPYGRPKYPDQICPSGHRYRALGNSMAVPVIRWIGERIYENIK